MAFFIQPKESWWKRSKEAFRGKVSLQPTLRKEGEVLILLPNFAEAFFQVSSLPSQFGAPTKASSRSFVKKVDCKSWGRERQEKVLSLFPSRPWKCFLQNWITPWLAFSVRIPSSLRIIQCSLVPTSYSIGITNKRKSILKSLSALFVKKFCLETDDRTTY